MTAVNSDDDLDRAMGYAFVRRLMAAWIAESMNTHPFSGDPLTTAHELGRTQFGRDLDKRIRSVCPEKWLLMHQEILSNETDEEKEP